MEAKINVDSRDRIGNLNIHVFGTMLENWGEPGRHTIYGSIWVGENSSIPNVRGLRKDVLEATKKMGPTIIRWPGGCPADVYHWLDGVGPREERPQTVLPTFWSVDVEETNEFGTHEFIDFCREVGADPYINVNVGTGTPEEAANWVEYCNREGKTKYAIMRVKNGHPEPFNVKYWGIGNELYGWWEVGHMDAEEHACVAFEYAKVMKMVDPTIKVVAVGCDQDEWNYQLLKKAGRNIDFVSIHKYYRYEDYYTLVACPLEAKKSLERLSNLINAIIDPAEREIKIAVDEWNVWHKDAGPRAFYQRLTLQDGLFAAGMFHTMHKMCNSVGMANLCDLINSGPCGPIVTNEETLFVNPEYLAFSLYRHHIGDIVLHSSTEVDTYNAGEILNEKIDNVPYLDCLATLSEEKGKLYLAVINRHRDEDIECTIKLRDFRTLNEGEVYELNAEDVMSANDFDSPDNVRITKKKISSVATSFNYIFPRHSATVLEITAHPV